MATITPERFDVLNLGTDTANVQISNLEFSQEDAARGKHAHFMLKEIYEQPQTVLNALRGRLDFEGATAKFGGLNMTAAELRGIDRIVIAASGTSWHAALVGEYLIEELAQLPVEVEFAHEFCYRNCPLEKNTVLLVLSQSGETADTLAALREAKRRGTSRAGHRQRRRQHHRARIRRRHLHARRPGNRRGLDQGVCLDDHRF